ncbi:MAG: stage II sporulation protein R [Clostridiales bacterium]|nr:stage II sporulation protein R [Clostridiales bacterium]
MKKNIYAILFVICISLFSGCTSIQKTYYYKYDDVKNSIIRFHVIANSDSDEDQKLKLRIKDKVIDNIYPFLKESKTIEESREIIKSKENDIIEIANSIIKENGYDYKVEIKLERDNFPEKSYGSIILPQGNYEAFKIIIGSGEGKNWWCVMFPPLCFVDVTKGQVEDEKSKEELDNEIEKNTDDNTEEEDVEVKFKIVEWFEDIFN